jgi:oligopeptide/dipeptide ABC transporter ATP-binding protein
MPDASSLMGRIGLQLQRVVVMGPPGSGKSTLARNLGARFGLPVLHLDQIYWRPGWIEAPAKAFCAEVERIAGLPAWVIDGNYPNTIVPRFRAADTVIYLDVPSWLFMSRIAWRILTNYGRVRADAAPGCPEWLDLAFLRFRASQDARSSCGAGSNGAASARPCVAVQHRPSQAPTSCPAPVSKAMPVGLNVRHRPVGVTMMDVRNQSYGHRLGLTIVFIAHDLAVVAHIADRIAVMYLGRLSELGSMREVMARPRHPYTEALFAAAPVPDPSRRGSRALLAGDVPSPINPPSGCAFRTRCRYALPKCAEHRPDFREVAPGHFAACILDFEARDTVHPTIPEG